MAITHAKPTIFRLTTTGLAVALVAGGTLLAAPAFASDTSATTVSVADVDLPTGTATIDGTPEVGTVLTVSSDGWPVGTTLTYEWYYHGGNFGGPIEDRTGVVENQETYTVDPELIGLYIGVLVHGELDGYTSTFARAVFETVAFTAQLPAGAAPVSNSSDLPAFLADQGVTPQSQTDAGLPAGDLASGTDYTASVFWGPGDSFVDVYAFSTPTFIGTVPVVDGVAQVALTGATLTALGAGSHTLVLTGQTSGTVQAVDFSVAAALAATGTDATAPLSLAGGLLLLGGALFLLRRRARA